MKRWFMLKIVILTIVVGLCACAQENTTASDRNSSNTNQQSIQPDDSKEQKLSYKSDPSNQARNHTGPKSDQIQTQPYHGIGQGEGNPNQTKPQERQQLDRKQHLKQSAKANDDIQKFDYNYRKSLNVKAIYVSGHAVAHRTKFNELIHLMEQTELNAMVIDVKDDYGRVTYDSQIPLVRKIGASANHMISDLPSVLKKLKAKNIYTIARVVTFKDPHYAKMQPSAAIISKQGKLWRDGRGIPWLDPYKKEGWEYNLAIAEEAAKLGFDEVQFDYVRFPENAAKVDQEVNYDNPQRWSKAEVIARFLHVAKQQIHKTGTYVSADVFGLTTSVKDDMGIGQDWHRIAQEVDFISPMLYPSHYGTGMYGIKHPDLEPYRVIQRAIADAKKKHVEITAKANHQVPMDSGNNSRTIAFSRDNKHNVPTGKPQSSSGNETNNEMNKEKIRPFGQNESGNEIQLAVIRPWYQSFTASWVKPHKAYGANEIRAQIRAAKEQGIEQYLLWNPRCQYPIF